MKTAARTLARMALSRGLISYHARLHRDPVATLLTLRGRSEPYPIYRAMRAAGPLTTTTLGALVSPDHAVCTQVLRSRDFGAQQRRLASALIDLSLLVTDPPDHTRQRRLVGPAFSPPRMALQTEHIQRAADRLVDDLAARLAKGPVDLMEAYAHPLPIAMIASLMGIPDADVPTLGRHGAAVGRVLDGVQSVEHFRRVRRARAELETLFDRLAERRRAEPTEDIVGDLVAALDAGELSVDEYHGLCVLVLLAGFETTVNLIGNAVSTVLRRPELWQRLVADPRLADRVCDETLRWDSPVQATSRIAVRDTELAGRPVPEGTVVMLMLGAANRDPAVFSRPDEFDIDRPNAGEHLAFSHGIHHCVGRPLATLEGRIAVATLARRLPGLTLAGPVRPGTGFILHGRAEVPVRAAGGRSLP